MAVLLRRQPAPLILSRLPRSREAPGGGRSHLVRSGRNRRASPRRAGSTSMTTARAPWHLPLRRAGSAARRGAACLCVGMALLPSCVRAQEPANDFYHDFRGRPVPPELAPFGEGVSAMIRVEPEGL